MKVENQIQNLLKRVGLNQYEAAVYIALISNGISTVGGIAEHSHVPRSRVYDVLGSLEKKGFAIVQLGRPVKYAAVKPDMVVDNLKRNAEKGYRNELEHVESIGIDLKMELGKIAKQQKTDNGAISIVRGEDNIHSHLKSMITSANEKILKVTDHTGVNRLHKHYHAHFVNAKNRGVKTKILTSNHKVKIPEAFKKYAETRHNKKMKGRFFVKDGKESFILTAPDTGIWIRGQYLANSLEQLFEHSWQNSLAV